MPDQGFDISSLMNFKPSQYFCEKCLALLVWPKQGFFSAPRAVCPVCHVVYNPSIDYHAHQVTTYLANGGYEIEFKDLMGHSKTLAAIAVQARASQNTAAKQSRPIQALFQAMLSAQQFIHFTTYGISPLFVGAIKLVAQRVHVRGIISNADNYAKDEFVAHKDEAPYLDVQLFERSDRPVDWDAMPHQKLIVIDGLLAFKGSANLTTSGWRKAAQGLDVIEVVTDVDEVRQLHNRYFSPVWANFSEIGTEISMVVSIPF